MGVGKAPMLSFRLILTPNVVPCMIYLKNTHELSIIKESAKLVSKTLGMLTSEIHPGVTTLYLDHKAEEFIRDHGGIPAFLGLYNFPNTLCVSTNEQIVHGIPNKKPLSEGDIVSIDCGVLMNGYYGDQAYTFAVGEISEDRKKLIEVTKNSLYRGIYSCRIGNRTGDIGSAIQNYAEKYGYGVVREFVGHGLGKNLHENPRLPNYGKRGSGKKLLEGMVLAIEPMINQGTPKIIKKDDWTIITADNKPSVHFEHNVAIVNGNPILLSTYKFIYQTLNIHSYEEEPFIIKDY